MAAWGKSFATRNFDPNDPADIEEVNRIYNEQIRPGLRQGKVGVDKWINAMRDFVAKAGIVPDGFRGQAETLLDSEDPETKLIGAKMIKSLLEISPKSMGKFDPEKMLFARHIVEARLGENGNIIHSTVEAIAVAVAKRKQPGFAAQLRAELKPGIERERIEREKTAEADSRVILAAMGFSDGKTKTVVKRFSLTLNRVLNDMTGFKSKVAKDPDHMKKIQDGFEDLFDEGNGGIAYQIRQNFVVAGGAPAKEPWALGDDDLKRAVSYYNRWLAGEESIPTLKLKKVNNPVDAKNLLAVFRHPAVVFVTSIRSELRKARDKAMIELNRRGLSMD